MRRSLSILLVVGVTLLALFGLAIGQEQPTENQDEAAPCCSVFLPLVQSENSDEVTVTERESAAGEDVAKAMAEDEADSKSKDKSRFKVVAEIGQPAAGGGPFTYTFAFQPSALNNKGQVGFVASIDDTFGEGVFVGRPGRLARLMRYGESVPGGTLGAFELGRLGLNDEGDVAVAFDMNIPDAAFPFGAQTGLFRYDRSKNKLRSVVLPGDKAPGGKYFAGVFFNASLNNRGDIVFSGVVSGADIDLTTAPGINGLGTGVYRASSNGKIVSVVKPGDAAPGGGTFDTAWNGWINEKRDVVFGGHVVGEECVNIGTPLTCGESIYLKNGKTGEIASIAHQGDAAPGGGIYQVAFGGVINNRGDIVFIGNLGEALGVYLHRDGTTIAVAKPGDEMPGGGKFVTTGNTTSIYHLNSRGAVSFCANLDTTTYDYRETLADDGTPDGKADPDMGIYVRSKDKLTLVARTGTEIPGIGTISYFGIAPFVPTPFATGGILNDKGQVLFYATLTDGRGLLLIAETGEDD